MKTKSGTLFLFALLIFGPAVGLEADWLTVDDFERPDSRYHGHGWESMSPGYWKIENNSLRRRLVNLGNRNPITSFPWHWSQGGREIANRRGDRLPNLPVGMIWRRDWSLSGNYQLRATVTIRDLNPPGRGEPSGYFGLCFGGESLFETRNFRGAPQGASSWMAIWEKDGTFKLSEHGQKGRPLQGTKAVETPLSGVGDRLVLSVEVSGDSTVEADVTVKAQLRDQVYQATKKGVNRAMYTDGFIGLAAYGALDFEVNKVEIYPGSNRPVPVHLNELLVAYPLGDTLRQTGGKWTCKFIALFRSEGK